MVDKLYITTIIEVIIFCLISLFASVYSLLILLVRRFHHQNNIFILNMCFNIIGSSIYFIIFHSLFYFAPQRLFIPNTCIFLFYAFNIASIEIPFGFVIFSAHRLCSLVYRTKLFFKTKRWVGICIASQWIVVCVVSLPFVFRKERVNILTKILKTNFLFLSI